MLRVRDVTGNRSWKKGKESSRECERNRVGFWFVKFIFFILFYLFCFIFLIKKRCVSFFFLGSSSFSILSHKTEVISYRFHTKTQSSKLKVPFFPSKISYHLLQINNAQIKSVRVKLLREGNED